MPGGATPGFTGGMSLGGSTFYLAIDDSALIKGMAKAKTDLQKLDIDLNRTAKQGMETLGKGSSKAAQGLLQLGYAVDDLQYGFKSIVNNIPQIVYQMGGGAGIAGAVAIAAVGVNLLITHWGTLTNAFQAAWSGSTLEQLEKIRIKAEENTKAFDKLAEAIPKVQKASMEGFSELVTEGPFDAVLKKIREGVGADPLLGAKEKQIPQAIDILTGKRIPEKEAFLRAQAKAEKEDADSETTRQLMGGAARGDKNALLTLAGLAKRRGDTELERQIMELTPEGQEKKAAGKRMLGDTNRDLTWREKQKQEAEAREGAQKGFEVQQRENRKRSEKEREGKEEQTAKRLSQGFVGQALLQGRAVDSKAVAQVMKAMGIDVGPGGQRGKEVLKDIKKDLKDEIAAKMGETGANAVQARAMVELEHRARLMGHQQKQEGGRSEFVGFADFAKKIQTGALNAPQDTLLKQQLQKMEQIRVAILGRAIGGNAALAGGPP